MVGTRPKIKDTLLERNSSRMQQLLRLSNSSIIHNNSKSNNNKPNSNNNLHPRGLRARHTAFQQRQPHRYNSTLVHLYQQGKCQLLPELLQKVHGNL